MGVDGIYGCGCKNVYISYYLSLLLLSVLFCSSIPTFFIIKKCFSFLFQYFFVIKF